MAIALTGSGSDILTASPQTYTSVDTATGSPTLLLVALSFKYSNSQTVTSVQLVPGGGGANIPLTFKSASGSISSTCRVELWYLKNPPSHASHSVTVTLSSAALGAVGWSAWSGLDVDAVDTATPTTAVGVAPSVPTMNVSTTAATEQVVDVVAATIGRVMVQGAGQTLIWALKGGGATGGTVAAGQSYEAGTGSPVTMDWTNYHPQMYGWAMAAIVLTEAAAPTEVSQTFTVEHEALQQVTATFAVPQEAVGQLNQLFMVPVEAVQEVTQTFAVLHESRVSISQTFTVEHESLQQVSTTFDILYEATSVVATPVSQTFAVLHEATQGISSTLTFLHEAPGGIASTFTTATEAVQQLTKTFSLPHAGLQGVTATFAILHESTSTDVIVWASYGPDSIGFRFYIDGSKHTGATWYLQAILSTTDNQVPANVRLYNVTADEPVSNSQIVSVSTTPEFKRSAVLTLPAAETEYRIEFGRKSGAVATIDMAEVYGVK